jgi:hypothetical protein
MSDTIVINTSTEYIDLSVTTTTEQYNVSITEGDFAFWGTIFGTLTAQTDLWNVLSAKALNADLIDLSGNVINFEAFVNSVSGSWNGGQEALTVLAGNSALWDFSYNVATFVQANSALWEESSEIIPTVTNYLSTVPVTLSSADVRGKLLSAGTDLFDIFLTSETDSQTLSYTPSSYNLSISNGNTVNLSSIVISPDADAIFNTVSATALSGVFYGDGSNLIGASLPGQKDINTVVQSGSANWNFGYNAATFVQANSASWEESAEILPTVTNYLSTNNVLIHTATVIGSLSANTVRTPTLAHEDTILIEKDGYQNLTLDNNSGWSGGLVTIKNTLKIDSSDPFDYFDQPNIFFSDAGLFHATGPTASQEYRQLTIGANMTTPNGADLSRLSPTEAGPNIQFIAGPASYAARNGLTITDIQSESPNFNEFVHFVFVDMQDINDPSYGTIKIGSLTPFDIGKDNYIPITDAKIEVDGNVNIDGLIRVSATGDSLLAGDSNKWNSAYQSTTALNLSAGLWNNAYKVSTTYQGASGSFATNTALNAASSVLLPTSIYQQASGTWQSASTNVQSNSANWNTAFNRSTVFSSVSSRYNNTSTAVESNSANWNNAYNTGTVYQANSATYATSSFVNSNFLNLTGGTIEGNLTLSGNIYIAGSAAIINATDLVITDPLIFLAEGNPSDLLDIGFTGTYNFDGPPLEHTGLVRSHNTKKWTLFSGLTTELLSALAINFDDPSLQVDTLRANLEGNVVGGSIQGTVLSSTGVVYALGGNSDLWNTAFNRSTVFSLVSGRYDSSSTAVESNSANWNFGYNAATFVQANSALWEESSEILPTVTNYLSTSNVLISSLEVNDRLDIGNNLFFFKSTNNASYYPYTVLELYSLQGNTGSTEPMVAFGLNGEVIFGGNQAFFGFADRAGYTNRGVDGGFYKLNNVINFWNNFNAQNTVSISDNGDVYIGLNAYGTFSSDGTTSNIGSRLFVDGTISTTNDGNSIQWYEAYTNVQSNSANWNTGYNISTAYQGASSSFATNTSLQSVSSLLTPLTLTNNLTSQLVLNTDFNNYRTSIAAATATLLPTTIYQNASGTWQSASTNVQSNSANWNTAFNRSTVFSSVSSRYDSSSTVVESNSANWNTAYNIATAYSSVSSSFATRTLLQSTSALLTPLTLTNTLTSQLVLNTDFNNYRTSIAAATATLLPTSIYQGASGFWQSASTNVQSNSANWNTAFNRSTVFSSVSGRYDSTSTAVESNSANWNRAFNTATFVQANSANWEESAEILPTVTNYLSTNNVLLSSATVANTLSISSVQIRTRPTANVFIGDSTTGNNNATGNHNFVFGLSAGNALTSGSNNVFIGNCAGRSNTTGSSNNFFGSNAGRYNTTGSVNNFFGSNAGCFNATGGSNNFFGSNTGRSNTTGSNNNFFGSFAGRYNTTGDSNNFFGNRAGRNNTAGIANNFFGYYAGYSNTTGCSNNFFGLYAGRSNTTGGCNNFFGSFAGRYNTTGDSNNFFGNCAGRNNTTGGYNNFLGYRAGRFNTTGSCNNFLGNCAGCTNTVGSNNTIIGNGADVTTGALDGVIVLGTRAVATESHQVVLSTANVQFRNLSNTFNIGAINQPNNLTVFGTVSTSNHGNSQQWNSAYTTVLANSASWEESSEILPTVTNYLSTSNVQVSSITVTDTLSVLGTFYSTGSALVHAKYTQLVGNNSSTNYTVGHNFNTTDVQVQVYDVAANILVYPLVTILNSNSVRVSFEFAPSTNAYKVVVFGSVPSNQINAYGEIYTFFTTATGLGEIPELSANWNESYTLIQQNSATTWNYQGTDLKALSANWQNTFTTVTANSANWQVTYTNVQSNSANWQGTFTTVQTNSANWNTGYNNGTVYAQNSATYISKTLALAYSIAL